LNIEITIEENDQKHIQQVVLRMGSWTGIFPNDQYKWMLARALNACVYNEENEPGKAFRLHIPGYLFYEKEIFLVLRIQKKQLPRMLHFFSEQLKNEIIAELARVVRFTGNTAAKRILKKMGSNPVRLYRQYPFTNQQLVRLITGHDVKKIFHHAEWQRLQYMVRGNPFCSAIDYAGGEGPVAVAKKWILHIE